MKATSSCSTSVARPSFSGLLATMPADVRSTVAPPHFFKTYPGCRPQLVSVMPMDPGAPIATGALVHTEGSSSGDFLRCVCISDTHNGHNEIPPDAIPPADVLIHSGDLTDIGLPKDIHAFCAWLDSLTHVRHKLVIAGNHDLSLDSESYPRNWRRFRHPQEYPVPALEARLRQSCIYLNHEAVEIDGVRFFGSPYQPEFYDWAFNLSREDFSCYDKWASIPSILAEEFGDPPPSGGTPSGMVSPGCVDVLVTHGPPLGILDLCDGNGHQGCLDLLDFVLAARPAVHVFGHIHEDYGAVREATTGCTFINASLMNLQYRMNCLGKGGHRRFPIVVDVPKRLNRSTTTTAEECHAAQPLSPGD